MLGMTGSFMLVELIVGNWTNSMALVADSFHMLSDVIALVIAYVCVRMSPKKWQKNTFGYARAEVVGALINAVFLFALCFSIAVESLKRFLVIETIENPVLILNHQGADAWDLVCGGLHRQLLLHRRKTRLPGPLSK